MKKLLALLTALTLALSLIAVAPVMATGEEGEAELTVYETIRKATNKINNGDFEADDFVTDKTNYNFGYRYDMGANPMEVSISTKESYSGNKSLLVSKKSGNGNYVAGYDGGRRGATYIFSAMILGTEANRNHVTGNTLASDATYSPRFSVYINAIKDGGAGVNDVNEFEVGATKKNETYINVVDFLTAAASNDEDGEKSSRENWKRVYNTFEFKETSQEVQVFAVGVGSSLQTYGYDSAANPDKNYVEFYSDDYYFGELMVADIKLENEKTINVPSGGSVTVELDAQAYNQIENTAGLEDAEYTYELVGDSAGAYIIDNKLTVTNSAQAGNLTVKVTAEPKFKGADTQEEAGVDVSYRTKEFNLTVVKGADADLYASLRSTSNILSGVNTTTGLENFEVGYSLGSTTSGTKQDNFKFFDGWKKVNTNTVSDKQAYSGSKSNFVTAPEGSYSGEAFAMTGSVKKGTTLVSSAMVLGTAANTAAVEANPDASVGMKIGYYVTGYMWSFGDSNAKTSTQRNSTVLLNTMLDAPASTEENQPKADASDWKMVHATGYWPADLTLSTGPWYFGTGVYTTGVDVEYYVDDYYLGELVVAKVESATDTLAKIGEVDEIDLKATAYNQLGNTEYFDGETASTYTWSIAEGTTLPAGVTLDSENNKLIIAEDAEAGKAILNVTFNPTFIGASNQTDPNVLARRTTTVVIDIVENPGFKFTEAEGSITATAVVGTLDADAKAYCALYKVLEGGAKKLMGVEAKDVVAGGENVEFTAITAPDYNYEIKCFMWYENNPMKNVINAVVYPQ
ncbi:MAG: hypothetical protein IKA17_02925 [Clostridia bacterium]|nr:hypothetical protein [Clostridia bacterium]